MTPNPIFKQENGFTLTEMLVAIIIFVLIIVTVYSAHTLSHQAYQKGEQAAEITQNGRVILERMTREIRQAKEIATELSDDETGATSTIVFQDGHDISFIHYVHYFRDSIDKTVKREEFAYYFSISGDPNATDTYVTWDATPPPGETLTTITLESAKTIGEYVADLGLWGLSTITISLSLEKNDKTISLKTKILGRNL